MSKPRLQPYIYGTLSGICTATAFITPNTIFSSCLGWIAVAALVLLMRLSNRPYLDTYIAGIVANAAGFYWLYFTIGDFGGFSALEALSIYALFVLVSSIQFPVFALLYRYLPAFVDTWGIRAATAWVFTETVPIRIFPWNYGHTQLSFSAFAQSADLAGSLLISFMMFWVVESAFKIFAFSERRKQLWVPLALMIVLIVYGYQRIAYISALKPPQQEVAIVQANISTEEKHNIKFFLENFDSYVRLSKAVAKSNRLIVWPESTLMQWVYASVGSTKNDPRLPDLGTGISYLVGALTFDSKKQLFNSALPIYQDGTVPYPYHKQVLMPFGEYVPLVSVFPWLRNLVINETDFTPGDGVVVFRYPITNDQGKVNFVKVSPLICYEDVMPELSRQATLAGADLLINITNDAWFGKSAAPYQHHLIASFRAIENRRTLIRSTNSGLSAIVNPLGETIAQIPIFSEGTALASVDLLDEMTVYTLYGYSIWWILAVLSLVFTLIGMVREDNKQHE